MEGDKLTETVEKPPATSLKGFSKPKDEISTTAVIKSETRAPTSASDDTQGPLDKSLVRATENVNSTACKPFIPKIKLDEEIIKLSMKWQLKEGLIFRLGVRLWNNCSSIGTLIGRSP